MIEEAIAREKQLKKWRRDWKVNLIERHNPDWVDLFPRIFHQMRSWLEDKTLTFVIPVCRASGKTGTHEHRRSRVSICRGQSRRFGVHRSRTASLRAASGMTDLWKSGGVAARAPKRHVLSQSSNFSHICN